jgi:transposase
MSAPLPYALRARFQRYIKEGLSGRAAALRLKLSPAMGARWALAIGRAEAAPQGRPREARASWTHIALCLPRSLPWMATSRCPSWVLSCLTRRGCAHPNAIGKFLRKLGYTYKSHWSPPSAAVPS